MEKLPVEIEKIAQNVSQDKRQEVQQVLNQVFSGVAKMRAQLDSIVVADANDETAMKMAATIRIAIKRIRLDAEKAFDAKRAEVQAQMLQFQTQDKLWLKAKQIMQALTKEIEEAARYKEETKKRFDAQQRELKVQQRIARLSQFFLVQVPRIEFEHMSDDNFELFVAQVEQQHKQKLQQEQERIAREKAEAEERERIKRENERLKAERAKLEAELKAKLEAERKAKLEAERAAKRAAAAPDKEKLVRLALQIDNIVLPEIKSEEALNILNDVKVMLQKISKFIREKADVL